MSKHMTISLGTHFENFVASVLNSGRYDSATEVVRAALRLLEEQENKSNALTQALIEGEESGFIKDFDPEILLNELHKKHGVK